MRTDSLQVRPAHGFTLVELLVVMGIIAVLTALLVPSLNVSRENARSLQCLSNLRQMVVACQTYAATYRGYYPPALQSHTAGNLAYYDNWDYTIITDLTTFKVTVEPGLLWMGKGDQRIFQCPSFYGSAMAAYNEFTGYNYNTSYIGRGQYSTPPTLGFDPPAKFTDVRRPEATIVFGDGEYSSGADKFMRSPLPSGYGSDNITGRYAGTQGFRHRRMTNAAFADGHAQSLADRRTAGNSLVAAGTGFVSDDNELYDLK